MKVTRTCRIELSNAEVKEALTKYIREECRYKIPDIEAGEECLAWLPTDSDNAILLDWGEPPEEAPLTSVMEAPPATSLDGTTARLATSKRAETNS